MRCPTPWKQGFPSRADAAGSKVHSGQREFRCPGCGCWHLSGSNAPGKWEAAR